LRDLINITAADGAAKHTCTARYDGITDESYGPLEVANMKTATLNWKLAACAAGAALMAGCAMDPPGPSPIYSRLPDNAPVQQQTLTAQQQMERYNAIDKQALAESQKAAQMGNDAKMMSNYYTPAPAPVSVYGGYSSGGWGGPAWGTGVGWGW
jgi:hypothetical protein